MTKTRRDILKLMALLAVMSGGALAQTKGVKVDKKRILVTGSSTGIGQMSAKLLISQGHEVWLHGRNPRRSSDATAALSGEAGVLTGDFTSMRQIRAMAEAANKIGRFDAVIHNAGTYDTSSDFTPTEDGLTPTFSVNLLAPYMLSALMTRPDRLIYISSSAHRGVDGRAALDDPIFKRRRYSGGLAYGESKLMVAMLAFALARRWGDVRSSAVRPGWVPTRMGGAFAPDPLEEAHLTQCWLATSDEAKPSGKFWYHMKEEKPNPDAQNEAYQDELLALCEKISGVKMPM
jgi:NAD(P)-dependent dehydrogenase (short-subunit alcohol dehydrogenase family)